MNMYVRPRVSVLPEPQISYIEKNLYGTKLHINREELENNSKGPFNVSPLEITIKQNH